MQAEVTRKLQAAVQKAIIAETKPTIGGVQKLKSNDIWFKCEREEEVQWLWEIDWTEAYSDIQVWRTKFGAVIYGISIDEIDPHNDMEEHTRQLKKQNKKLNLKITKLRTFKASSKLDCMVRHYSFVIWTHDLKAPDQCLKEGLHYNYRLYPAEKYIF